MTETIDVNATARLVHRIKLVALFLVGGFLYFAYFAGQVRYHVAAAYVWLPPAGATVLALMWAARLAAGPRAGADCCDHGCPSEGPSPRKAITAAMICLAILATPIALALAVQPKEFSPEGMRKRLLAAPRRDLALNRAIDWICGLAAAPGPTESEAVGFPKDPTLLELVELSATRDPEQLEGKFVTLIGRCDLPEGEGSRRFDIYRLRVTCCVADASAVSFGVARPDAGVRLEQGGWVRIGGVLKYDDPIDPSTPTLHAATIAKIAEPAEPYL